MANPYVAWIALLVSVATLGWNIYDKIITRDRDQKNKNADYRRGQWLKLRTDVEKAAEGLRDKTDLLMLAAMDSQSSAVEKFTQANFQFVTQQDRLAVALERCQNSSYLLEPRNWLELAIGVEFGGDTCWDRINAVITDASQCTTSADKFTTLSPLVELTKELFLGIEAALRCEDHAQEPDKNQ